MINIANIRYCGAFNSISKICKPNEGDHYLIMQDPENHQEYLFVVERLHEEEHKISLEDKMAIIQGAGDAVDEQATINRLKDLRFYYFKS